MMYWNNLDDMQKMKELLRKDQILLVSGDTVVGLLGQLTLSSYDALNELKQRQHKPHLIMIPSIDVLPKLIDQPIGPKVWQIIDLCWPGPVTIIFKARADLPRFLQGPDGTIALRVPDHVGLLELLKSFDGLFSTSANVHTGPLPQVLKEVDQEIMRKVGGVCVDAADQIFSLLPSTILDCSSSQIKLVRQGCCLNDKVKELMQ